MPTRAAEDPRDPALRQPAAEPRPSAPDGGALGLAILASVGAAHTGTRHGVGHAALAAGFSAAYGVAAGIFAAIAMIGSLILPRQVSTPDIRRKRAGKQRE